MTQHIVQAFGLLMPYFFIATDLEAVNIGIFLNAVMHLYNRWLVSFSTTSQGTASRLGFFSGSCVYKERMNQQRPFPICNLPALTYSDDSLGPAADWRLPIKDSLACQPNLSLKNCKVVLCH